MGLSISRLKVKTERPPHRIGDEKKRVIFGRDRDLCDVVFAPDETSVGREHFALERELGRYRLVLHPEHLVLVDGHTAEDGSFLPSECRIQIGPEGPELLVRTTQNTDLDKTIAQGYRVSSATKLHEAHKAAKSSHRAALLSIVLLTAAAVGTYFLLRDTKKDVDSATTAAKEALDDVRSMKDELHTVRGDLTTVRATTEAVSALVPKRLEKLERALQDGEPALRAALMKARPSVYLVLMQGEDGREAGVGTAWVVAPKTLATNAHVAEVYAKRPEGAKLLARSTETHHNTFEITATTIHPGYADFEEEWREYEPVSSWNTTVNKRVHAAGSGCDVALLTVDTSSASLGSPLTIASTEEIRTLRSATPVGYVGFPMENMVFGGTPLKEPTPQTQVGVITSVTDYFGSATADNAHRLLIQHNCPSTGGSSGSPILNARGHVVGVLNAGNMIHRGGDRQPSAAGVNFAQRVDLVQELLDKTAATKQKKRGAAWRKRLSQLFDSGYLRRRKRSTAAVQRTITERVEKRSKFRKSVKWDVVHRGELALSSDGDQPSVYKSWKPDKEGVYLVIVMGKRAGPFTSSVVQSSAGQPIELKAWDNVIRWAVVKLVPEAALEIRAETDDDEGVNLEIHVYRGTEVDITPNDLRERVITMWLRSLNGKFTAKQAGSTKGTLEENKRWSGTSDEQPPGNYLAVAVSLSGDDIDLGIRLKDKGPLIAKDEKGDHFPAAGFRLKEKSKIGLLVAGSKPGVEFELHLYRAEPKK